jgi:hypothetical protein
MYQPMNTKGRVWRVASRIAASAGALRLLPRAQAPPQAVREILSPYLAPRSAVAVGRANHPNRFLALVVPDDAAPSVVKVAADPGADDALEREVRAIQRWGSRLPPPLAAPTVMAREPGVLVLKGVEWVARPRPWRLEEEVARALGVFFSEQAGGGETGPAHGDFAPWNILRTRGGWLVIDWEAAIPEAPPLYDLFHWMVQAHLHLGRPSQAELFHGIREGPGWVGGAIRAYGAGAGIDAADAWARFRDHLSLSAELLGRAATPPSDDIEGRRRLLAEAES